MVRIIEQGTFMTMKDDVKNVTAIANKNGYSLKTYPYTRKGMNHPSARKIVLTNSGRSTANKLRNSRSLERSSIDKYLYTTDGYKLTM